MYNIYVCIYIYIYMYVCMYVYIYIYIYIYIYDISWPSTTSLAGTETMWPRPLLLSCLFGFLFFLLIFMSFYLFVVYFFRRGIAIEMTVQFSLRLFRVYVFVFVCNHSCSSFVMIINLLIHYPDCDDNVSFQGLLTFAPT